MTNPTSRELRSRERAESQLSAQNLFNEICDIVLHATGSQEIIYENVPREVGSPVTQSLAVEPRIERNPPRIQYNSVTQVLRIVIMPARLHDCHLAWLKMEFNAMLVGQFLSLQEADYLTHAAGTTFDEFTGMYAGSSKQPDYYVLPNTDRLPTVVVESGWSESWPHLQSDRNLWLSDIAVKYDMLINWSKIANDRVKGFIEIYHRNQAGAAVLLYREDIFPIPTVQRTIPITIGEMFGSSVFPGRNPNDTWQMSLNKLRRLARDNLAVMRLAPAT